MKCKRFIFSLTSSRLSDAGFFTRLNAKVHCLICPRCRAFKNNDDKVTQIVGKVKKGMMDSLR